MSPPTTCPPAPLRPRGRPVGTAVTPTIWCTNSISEEAGVIITTPTGGPLQAPLDTESNVAWVGYANRRLHAEIAPVLHELLRQHGLISIE